LWPARGRISLYRAPVSGSPGVRRTASRAPVGSDYRPLHQPASLPEGVPGSHRLAKPAEARLRPSRSKPHHHAEAGMTRPPPHVHGKEGVDGSSPSEGFTKVPAKRHVLLPVKTVDRRRGKAEGTFPDPLCVHEDSVAAEFSYVLQVFVRCLESSSEVSARACPREDADRSLRCRPSRRQLSAVAWLISSYVISANIDERFTNFGASGVILCALVTGLLLACCSAGRRQRRPDLEHRPIGRGAADRAADRVQHILLPARAPVPAPPGCGWREMPSIHAPL